MSTVVVSNVHFEGTGNNRIELTGTSINLYKNNSAFLTVSNSELIISNGSTSSSLGGSSATIPPIGAYISLSSNTANASYVPHDALYSKSTYSTLFNVVGDLNQAGYFFTITNAAYRGRISGAYGNNKFIVGSYGLAELVSMTGTVDSTRSTTVGESIRNCLYANGYYLAFPQNPTSLGAYYYNSTWANWTPGITVEKSVYVGGKIYAVVGNSSILTSTTLPPSNTSWTIVSTANNSSFLTAIAYGNGVFVAGDSSGNIQRSTDGNTWTYHSGNNGGNYVKDITYGNGKFVAVGNKLSIMSSTNGITWSNASFFYDANTTPEFYFTGVTYSNGTFVACAYNNLNYYTSEDCVNWAFRTASATRQTGETIMGSRMRFNFVTSGPNTVLMGSGDFSNGNLYVSTTNASSFYVPRHPCANSFSNRRYYVRAS